MVPASSSGIKILGSSLFRKGLLRADWGCMDPAL